MASMHGPMEFYVADSGLKFDLIFGREYMFEKTVVSINRDRFLTMVPGSKASRCEVISQITVGLRI